MSAEVRDLTGKVLPETHSVETDAENCASTLRALTDRIDAGEILPNAWLFVMDERLPADHSKTRLRTVDSGLTLADAVYLLRAAEFELFTMVFRE